MTPYRLFLLLILKFFELRARQCIAAAARWQRRRLVSLGALARDWEGR